MEKWNGILPPLGTRVEVTTRSSFAWMNFPLPGVQGIVARSQPGDRPATFRLRDRSDTWGKTHDQSLIEESRVQEIRVLEEVQDSQEQPATQHQVQGSRGDQYVVEIQGDDSSCSCPAGLRGRLCRHVKEVRAQL